MINLYPEHGMAIIIMYTAMLQVTVPGLTAEELGPWTICQARGLVWAQIS